MTSIAWKRALVILGCCCACAAPAQSVDGGRAATSARIGTVVATWTPSRIEVFATSAMYIANSERATVYRVDAHEQLIAELDQGGMPPDPQQALAIVRNRIKAMGPALQNRVQAALHSVQAVMVYGVQRVPAVVFDGSRVVYGVTDVAQAIDIVRRGGGQAIGERFISGTPADAQTPATTPSIRRTTP